MLSFAPWVSDLVVFAPFRGEAMISAAFALRYFKHFVKSVEYWSGSWRTGTPSFS